MTPNAEERREQAPRLLMGSYPSWRPRMDVWLEKIGASGVHKKEMSEEKWKIADASVQAWEEEAEADAWSALSLGAPASAAADSSSMSPPDAKSPPSASKVSDAVKESRKVIKSLVERSRKVYGILYSSLPEELCAQVAHLPQGWAFGLWSWLEKKFQSTEKDNVHSLLRQWFDLKQEEEESFDAYRARVMKLATLLELAKEKQSDRMLVFILLEQLQPRYKPAVLALQNGTKLADVSKIDWNDVAAFINAHERSEQRLQGDASADAQAMAVGMRAPSYSKVAQSANNPKSGFGGAGVVGRQNGSASTQRSGFKPMSQRECFHCHKMGHIKINCPERKEQHAAQPPTGAAPSSAAAASSSSSAAKAAGRGAQQVEMLRAVSLRVDENPYESLSEEEENGVVVNTLVASAGVCRAVSLPPVQGDEQIAAKSVASPPAPLSGRKRSVRAWGVDSMASVHVSGNLSLFSKMRSCEPFEVEVADGRPVMVSKYGTVTLNVRTSEGGRVKINFDKVYYHECFSSNLLSVGVLREAGWGFHSDKHSTYILSPGGNKIMLETTGRVSMFTTVADGSARVYSLGDMSTGSVNGIVRLHEKLGHMGFDRMIRIAKLGATLDVGKLNVSAEVLREARRRVLECKACTQGKGHRLPFGDRGVDVGKAKGEVLHMDTFFVPRTSPAGDRKWMEYGLHVIDPYARHRWFARLMSKDQIAPTVLQIVRNAQTQFNCKVRRLYGDGGSEFVNQTLAKMCSETGIEWHNSPPRTQELNGIAERGVRSLKEAMHTMMLAASTPARFWHRAAGHYVYMWNRTVVGRTSGMTPFEVMTGRKPSMRHWSVFGCDAFVHVQKAQRDDAFSPKMEPCIYLGHDHIQNCARVYVLSTGKETSSRDVVYRESSFTHAKALQSDAEDAISTLLARGYVKLDGDRRDEFGEEVALQGGMDSSQAEQEAGREYDVEAIIGRRTADGRTEYQVKWSTEEITWEPQAMMMEDTPQLVEEFEKSLREQPEEDGADAEEVAVASGPQSDPQPAEPPSPAAVPVSRAATAPLRESRRLRGLAAESAPQVQMCMSAISAMQTGHEVNPDEVIYAVSAGVALLEEQTPESYREAMQSQDAAKWREAMDKEMASCMAQDVWDLVPRSSLPKGTNILPVRWVYKIKTDESGNVTTFKARVTPKGFRQKFERDYFEVYAATGMYKSLRVGLSLAAKWDHEMEQLDVPVAFTNADLEEDVYMEIPEGYREGKEDMVCKLKKSLYGLKQSPRNWYLMIRKFFMEELGLKATVSDPCLFYKRSRTGRLIMLFLFVDDMQVSFHREDRAEWNACKQLLVSRFNTKDMGESQWILGMRIERDRAARTITLSQELYITKALEKYGLAQCKVASTPEVIGREAVSDADSDAKLDQPCDRHRYMEITGTVMYAAISTNPAIAHAAHRLACSMQAPTQRDMLAAQRVLRYLAGTKDVGLVFGSRNGNTVGDSRGHGAAVQVDVCAYADADWANGKSDRKSVSGWVAKINGDPVSWASKKQRTVALSTCEAELYAEAAAIQEVLWLRGLLTELGLRPQMSSVVHGDNQSAIAVSQNGIKGERTKHVDVKYHFITETVQQGAVKLQWVPTTQQQADIFTKALAAPVFLQLRKQLMTR